MEESFKPRSLSIGELFGDTKSLYQIPKYQRPYKWESEQVEQLWDDIRESYENEIANYFLGSVITASPNEEKLGYIDVVDGQQRLTTLMILFCVLRDHFPDLNQNDTDNPLTVNIDTIRSAITYNSRALRLRLYTHSSHQSDFNTLILNEGATKTLIAPYKYEIKKDQEPKFKFINTALIFIEKLNEYNRENQLGCLINYLFYHVKIIRIDCTSRDFAIKLFQVLNNRGLDLTPADLIKSFLLEKLYKKYQHDLETSKIKEDNFMSDWREMEQIIRNCDDISLNDLFIIYAHYLLGSNQKKSYTEELQTLFEHQDPNDVIAALKSFITNYYEKIYNTNNKIIYSFKYIRWSHYWKAILMTAITTNYKEFDILIFQLRRFYYLYWIAGKTLSQVKQTSFNVIKAIKDKKHINYLKAIFNNKLELDKIHEYATSQLISNVVDKEAWIKPLLILIEYNLTDQSNPNFIPLTNDLHLEHILPKKYQDLAEWSHITDDIKNKWLHSIANLTLLSGKKNIDASNNSFAVKMKIYQGNKTNNTTAFRLSQKILDDFKLNTFNQQWHESALQNRYLWILEQIEELLDIDLSSIEQTFNLQTKE